MLGGLRFVGFVIAHTIAAVIGTAVVEHAIWRVVPTHSIVAVLWKECMLSTICATLIGLAMWRTWRTSSAKWSWILPAAWFALGFLAKRGDVWGGIFGLHSGSVLSSPDTKTFFVFTVPLIRGAFYSVGAYISSLLYSEPVTSTR
jgi:hypothetical protein